MKETILGSSNLEVPPAGSGRRTGPSLGNGPAMPNGCKFFASSIGGLIGIPDTAVYHASKYGVIGPTQSAPLGYASSRAEEIAAAVLWLCSPDANFVIGHALIVEDGCKV